MMNDDPVSRFLDRASRLPPYKPGPWPFGPEVTLTPREEHILVLVGRILLAALATCPAAPAFADWLAGQNGYDDPAAAIIRASLTLLTREVCGADRQDGAVAVAVRRMVEAIAGEDADDVD